MTPTQFPRTLRLKTGLIQPFQALAGRVLDRAMAAGGGRICGRHMFVYDVAATMASIYLALVMRADALLFPAAVGAFMPVILAPLLARPLVNIRFGMYRRVWRYASVDDLLQTAIATLVGSLLALIAALGLAVAVGIASEQPVPTLFWVLEWTFNLAFVGGIRLVLPALSELRVHRSTAQSSQRRIPTLLFGAGTAGTMMARSAMREPKAASSRRLPRRRPGREAASRRRAAGLRRTCTSLAEAIAATGAEMLAHHDAERARVRPSARSWSAALEAGLEVRTVPPIHELLDGSSTPTGSARSGSRTSWPASR